MDPYLEHPALWPDVHNRLMAALADDLSERVAPRYYVGLERRTYLLKADDLVFVGRPDLAVAPASGPPVVAPQPATTSTLVLEVDVPMQDEVSENFLEIHEVKTGKLITIVELLSGDAEPEVSLNHILHDLYRRARFNLRLDYSQPPVPSLSEADRVWAQELIQASGLER
jgi:hypothetical protein